MRIEKGTYPLKERRLQLTLTLPIAFGETRTCVYLTGINGLGKTSFIEKILIPALREQHTPFMYVGQDFRTQMYTLKAMLAVTMKEAVPDNVPDILTQWVNQNRHARIFILDEFDKYGDHVQHLFNISRDFIRTYIMVSHANHPVQPGASFKNRCLTFKKGTSIGSSLQVTIQEVVPW